MLLTISRSGGEVPTRGLACDISQADTRCSSHRHCTAPFAIAVGTTPFLQAVYVLLRTALLSPGRLLAFIGIVKYLYRKFNGSALLRAKNSAACDVLVGALFFVVAIEKKVEHL